MHPSAPLRSRAPRLMPDVRPLVWYGGVMKATAPTLSEHLLIEAKRFRGYPGLIGHGRLNRAVTAIWDERALPSGARSLEWIMPKGQGFQTTPALLNEYYSKRLLAE